MLLSNILLPLPFFFPLNSLSLPPSICPSPHLPSSVSSLLYLALPSPLFPLFIFLPSVPLSPLPLLSCVLTLPFMMYLQPSCSLLPLNFPLSHSFLTPPVLPFPLCPSSLHYYVPLSFLCIHLSLLCSLSLLLPFLFSLLFPFSFFSPIFHFSLTCLFSLYLSFPDSAPGLDGLPSIFLKKTDSCKTH